MGLAGDAAYAAWKDELANWMERNWTRLREGDMDQYQFGAMLDQQARVLQGSGPAIAGSVPEPSIMQVVQALIERVQQLEKQCSVNADETRFIRARLGI